MTFRVARALRHRNYRLFFAGQGISLVGTWLTRFAIPFETYELSGSVFKLGLVAFCSQAPTSIIAPLAGVLVDRWDRHRTIIVTQICAMLQSAALAAFALTGTLTVWHLMALGAVQAVINAFDMPARQSFVRQIVAREDLANAIALNSSLVNAARLIGPVIAAVLVDLFGIGWCFGIDAASYLAVIGSLVAMQVTKQAPRVHTSRVLDDFREGLDYVKHVPMIRALLLSLAATSVLGGAYTSLLPAIANGTLHGGPHALGSLMAAAGAGALVGVLYLANRERVAGLERVAIGCAAGLGVGLIALEAVTSVAVAVPIMFVIGACLIVQWASSNTLVQTITHDDKMGRVMSLYAVAFFAGAPVGALLEGSLASVIGPIHTFAIAGAGCLVASATFARALPRLLATTRPRYIELGLIRE
ncbi:MAG TPA: MFS transporter [Kofleriaceae bacterium]